MISYGGYRKSGAAPALGRGQRAIVCAGDTRHSLVRVEACSIVASSIAATGFPSPPPLEAPGPCRSQRRDRRRRARGIARPERGRRQPRPSPLVGRCPHREAPFRMNPPRLFPLVGGRPSATCFCAFKRSQAPRVMAPFAANQSPLPTMMTHGANPSWRDWKDFSLLVMPIERAGTPLLMWMAEKRGNQRCGKSGSSWVLIAVYPSHSG